MSQANSPFKFLDYYQQEDRDIFFGREKEIDALYKALSGVKHLLVYGPSGSGKTSLVECGLRNQFSDADWFALTIRRGANMTESVFTSINRALKNKLDLNPDTHLPRDPDLDFGKAVERLFAERYQPVYLLLDQFEELLISGSEEEKKDFFTRLNQLIRYKVPCRVMIIMREEFIGHLSEFESLCPTIFQHRFRLEKMLKDNVKEVIHKTLEAPQYSNSFKVTESELLADSILSKLPDRSREIELAHVQVFLGELWERANKSKDPDQLPLLHQGLILPNDNLEGVLDSFLKSQINELEFIYGDKVPLELLAAMISEKHTKLQVSEEYLEKDLKTKEVLSKKPLPDLLRELEQRRILRTLKSGDQIQYEISHDVLALVVGRNLTDEMRLREKAADIYKVYEEKKGIFSAEDLEYIRPYQYYKAFPPSLNIRIQESEEFHHKEQLRIQQEKDEQLLAAQKQAEKERELREQAQKNARRARKWTNLAALGFVVALGLAGWGYYQKNQADELTKQTTLINYTLKNTLESLTLSSEKIKLQKDTILQNLELIQKKEADLRTNETALKASLREKDAALKKQIQAEKKAKDEQREKFITEGALARKHERYDDAQKAYHQALPLAMTHADSARILNDLEVLEREKNNNEFQHNKNTGLSMKAAGDCRGAILYLKKALTSRPDDKAVSDALAECN